MSLVEKNKSTQISQKLTRLNFISRKVVHVLGMNESNLDSCPREGAAGVQSQHASGTNMAEDADA